MTIEILKEKFNEVYIKDKEKLKGVCGLDFTFFAKSNGIIANNGNGFGTSCKIYNCQKGVDKELNNIIVPQCQNPPMFNIYVDDNDSLRSFYFKKENEKETKEKIFLEDHNPIKNTKISISAECFKKAMYKDYSVGLNNCKDQMILLTNPKTLINGFVNAEKGAIYRSGSTYFSNLSSDFLKTENLENFNFWKEKLGEDLTKEHFTKNGSLKLENHTTSGSKEATSLYAKFRNLLNNVFYKCEGNLDFEQLQFITIGGELGRDSLGESKEEDILNIKEMLEFSLNLLKQKVLKELDETGFHLKYSSLKEMEKIIKSGEIQVEYGKFRRLGSICQATDKNLLERGFLLNDVAVSVLTILFFDLLLKTKISNKDSKLEVVDLSIETISNIDEFKIVKFYEKIEE